MRAKQEPGRNVIHMKIPVDSQRFTAFIEEHHLFDKTKDHLITFLKNFYMQKPEEFEEMLYADADKVIHSYDFVNEGVSLSKSFFYDPPMDYISVWIRIYDNENDYLAEYTAFYDAELKFIEDRLK